MRLTQRRDGSRRRALHTRALAHRADRERVGVWFHAMAKAVAAGRSTWPRRTRVERGLKPLRTYTHTVYTDTRQRSGAFSWPTACENYDATESHRASARRERPPSPPLIHRRSLAASGGQWMASCRHGGPPWAQRPQRLVSGWWLPRTQTSSLAASSSSISRVCSAAVRSTPVAQRVCSAP